MILPHTLWRDAAKRVCLQAGNPNLTTDQIQERLHFIEFTTWPADPDGYWVRRHGFVTEPAQVICGHLVVWQFDFRDRHCTVWPVEILRDIVAPDSIHRVVRVAA